MKKLILIIPIVLFIGTLRAEVGCLVPDYPDLLITQVIPGAPFSNAGAIFPGSGCIWVLRSPMVACLGHGKTGIKGDYGLECPLDDNVPGLIIFTSIVGACYLLRKFKL